MKKNEMIRKYESKRNDLTLELMKYEGIPINTEIEILIMKINIYDHILSDLYSLSENRMLYDTDREDLLNRFQNNTR